MKVKQILSIKEIADDKRLPCDMYELYDTKYMSVSRDEMISIEDMDIVHLIRAFKNDRHRLANQLTDRDLSRQNDNLVSANKELARQHDIWKEKAMNMVEKSTHKDVQLENQRLVQQLEHDERNIYINEDIEDTLKDTIKSNNELIQLNKQLKESLRQVNLTPTVSTQAYDIAWKNNEELKKQVRYWKKLAEDNFIQSVDDNGNAEFWKKAYMDYDPKPKGCNYMFSEIPNDTDGQEFVDTMKNHLNKKSYKMRVRGQHIKPELKGTGATAFGQNIDESTHMRVYIDIK